MIIRFLYKMLVVWSEEKMRRNTTTVIASLLSVSFLLTAYSGGEDGNNKEKVTEKSSVKQTIQLPYIAEIPTMDVTKAIDGGLNQV